MFENFFVFLARVYFRFFDFSTRLRDFLMWPVASRVFGGRFDKIVTLKNGLRLKTDLKDILGRFVIFYGPPVSYFW